MTPKRRREVLQPRGLSPVPEALAPIVLAPWAVPVSYHAPPEREKTKASDVRPTPGGCKMREHDGDAWSINPALKQTAQEQPQAGPTRLLARHGPAGFDPRIRSGATG